MRLDERIAQLELRAAGRERATVAPGLSDEIRHALAGSPPGEELEDYLAELLSRVDRGEPTEADELVLAGCSVPTLRTLAWLEANI